MLRCALPLLAAASTFVAATTAQAQGLPRNFPATALRGEIVVGQPPEITLNGQASRLAPGSRIRGTNNLLVMSGAVVGQRLVVHYTLDQLGQPQDIWVLTPEELARKPWPATLQEAQTWRFDPAAQAWSKP